MPNNGVAALALLACAPPLFVPSPFPPIFNAEASRLVPLPFLGCCCCWTFGLRGDSPSIPPLTPPVPVPVLGGGTSLPVTFLLIPGRVGLAVGPLAVAVAFAPPFALFSGRKPATKEPPSKPPPRPNDARRAFSCLAWTCRKCENSSCHLISSRPGAFVLVEERAETDLISRFHNQCIRHMARYIRSRS